MIRRQSHGKRSQLAQAAFIASPCVFYAILCPWFGSKSCHSDGFVGSKANAIRPGLDANEGIVDLSYATLLVLDQAQSELLFPVIAAEVGHVDRHGG